MAVYLALTGNVSTGTNLVICGLAVCVIADAVLEYYLIPGAALFGAAHICFISSFITGHSHGCLCAACFTLVFALLCLLIFKYRENKPRRAPLWGFVLYTCLLATMTALSIDCGIWAAVGGILFALSDTVLFLRLFAKLSGPVYSWLLMGAYYSALFCIAVGSCG